MSRLQQLQVFFRSFFLQTGWNYAKYQNLGLTFVLAPWLVRMYKQDPDALPSVLQRYLENFNTQPFMASFCFGALARQEERLAQAGTLAAYQERLSEWNGIKRSLSITAASIGDRLFWGTLKPFTLLLALCIWLLLDINFFEVTPNRSLLGQEVFGACLVAFMAFNAVALFVKWKGLALSYYAENNGCFGLTQFDWNRAIYNAKKLGILLSVILLLWGVYYFVSGQAEIADVQILTRGVIVLFFVGISLMTRDLKIPNMYLYLVSMLVFMGVCFFV